ncbi:response regulator [Phormidium tenue FACHB-886]|nr:response regulator [Phormidium tenue FACHB-886]
MFSPKQTYRILAVDDIADNLFLLQTALELEGFAVDVATSGTLALSKIKTNPPDLLLLDVMMPDMNGYQVTQQIRQDEQLPTIPILLITAASEIKAVENLALGVDDVIHKPIDLDQLVAKVKRFLQLEQSLETDSSAISQASSRSTAS